MARQSFQDLIQGETPVLVDFSASWCGPCQTQKPMLQEFAQKMGDRVKVIEVDVDRNQAAASRYQVRSVPTLMLFKRGKVVWNHSGVAPVHTLQKAVSPHLVG